MVHALHSWQGHARGILTEPRLQPVVEGTGDLFSYNPASFNNIVDVADVARAHILAAINPKVHGRYIVALPDTYPPQVRATAIVLKSHSPNMTGMYHGWAKLMRQQHASST